MTGFKRGSLEIEATSYYALKFLFILLLLKKWANTGLFLFISVIFLIQFH